MTDISLLQACINLEPIFRRYAERQHIPGVAYGVVVDGDLIFTHSFGVRDALARANARGCGQRLSDRLDDQKLHGDGDHQTTR
jgi:hypothetical protein